MDCFLSEGMEVIFRIALALLSMGKDELLLLEQLLVEVLPQPDV